MSASWKMVQGTEGTTYTLATARGEAKVAKKGKTWILECDGQTRDLGRKASFDHAEGELRAMGAL